jgi:hypothetical protein
MFYNAFFESTLEAMSITKKDLWELMEVNDYKDFDFNLPQEWLNNFCDRLDLNYDLVRSTTFWVYTDKMPFGFPVSGCTEVAVSLPAVGIHSNR